jgi:hypothetical protein
MAVYEFASKAVFDKFTKWDHPVTSALSALNGQTRRAAAREGHAAGSDRAPSSTG